ncbi:hypothetical protein Slala03_76810 [Streptomyces lavendulae subsp. lavendulae]|uniref:hypothetical protein n=1 Tax=Streptomyces lavendulae TaxID=1914 RepID=UPI0024A10C76|nr:hypothetical protein [Streptomyces lavendulae]GLV87992.1 hypothetical protein Slala03_76810 [Streptomyces lavendulae subsp. lavendulae]
MIPTPPASAPPPTASDYAETAAYHFSAMVDRRSISLRMFTAVVILDFVATKLVMDAAKQTAHPQSLAWVLRLVLGGVFIALAGMVIQVELRNRKDRIKYRAYSARAQVALQGGATSLVAEKEEGFWYSVRQSWASTWALGAVLGLTIALCWFAGLITHPAPDPAPSPCKLARPCSHVHSTGQAQHSVAN